MRTLGGSRKVAIIGTHGTTLAGCPWDDPTWEFWGHASGAMVMPKGRISLYMDVHPEHCFAKTRKNGFKDYYAWLQHQPTPILMQKHYPEIPQSIEYPLAEMKSAYPGLLFGSQVAYFIAYALARGVTHIGLYGVEYAHNSEYRFQRGNAQMWIGIAIGRGVQVQVSPKSTLLREFEDYAYETHRTPEKVQEWIEFCGWKKHKAEPNVVDMQKLVPSDSEAVRAAAAAKRMEDPEYAASIRRIAEEEARRPGEGYASAMHHMEAAAAAKE
jgi:hypothetical protein